jgi:tetratricopeptide (TPR) repeat protein
VSSTDLGILIIEGDRELRAFYNGVFAKAGGYVVRTAATGAEGLEILKRANPDDISIVILDWTLHDMSGFVVAQKIRRETRYDAIDILICSTAITAEDTFLMAELDIRHSLPKRGGAGPLLEKINEIRAEQNAVLQLLPRIRNLQHLLREGNIEECEKMLHESDIMNEITNNSRFVYCVGELFILKKEFESATTVLQDYFRRNVPCEKTETLKTLTTLGKALCFLNRFDEALIIFERLAAKSPKNLNHKVFCGDALLGLGDVDGAKDMFGQVLENDELNQDALVGMGKAYMIAGDEIGAKSFFEKIEGNFESQALASFFNNRAVSLARSGKALESIQFYESALQFLDKFKSHVQFNLGMAYLRIGQVKEASHHFKQVLEAGDAEFIARKTILRKIQELGVEEFISEFTLQSLKEKPVFEED